MSHLSKRPCIGCESSDGLQPYEKEDGGLRGYCFSCGKHFNNLDEPAKKVSMNNFIPRMDREQVLQLPIRQESYRNIKPYINERFGVRVAKSPTTREDTTVYYPYYIKDQLAAFKVRELPKHFLPAIGNLSGVDLFGQHLWSGANSMVIVTEGEEDALAICQVLHEHWGSKRFPDVCSLVNGAGLGKGAKKIAKVLNQFNRIIFCLDKDEEGEKALGLLAAHLDSSKIEVMEFPAKDASELLQIGKPDLLVQAFLDKEMYRPKGVVSIADLKELYFSKDEEHILPFPEDWRLLNKYAYGLSFGRLDVFTAGTSTGKTQFFRELVLNVFQRTQEKIGCVFLEENLRDTLLGIGGLLLNKRVHLPGVRKLTKEEEMQESWAKLVEKNRLVFRDHQWDSSSEDTILASIEYMAKFSECRYIFLDHLSIIVSEARGNGKEHERIDSIMIKLKRITQQYNVWIGLIVHVRKPDNRSVPYSKGAIPSEDDLKGSSGLCQLADSIYALQRNRLHSNVFMKNVVRVHTIKHRLSGDCGPMDFFRYDPDSGRLMVIPEPADDILEVEEVLNRG